MSIPAIQKMRIGAYVVRQLLAGRRRFPLVLMLEPTFRCNLNCQGCGKIAYPEEVLERRLSLEECLDAAKECGAPVVSIPGGEPLLHPEIDQIVTGLIAQGRFVYLCTNALLAEERLSDFTPSPYLTFSIHIDGLRERHDALVWRSGVFDRAVKVIRLMVERGFRVTTNTTFFEGETPENAARLFDFLTSLGVEGMTVAPGFGYECASGQDIFLDRLRSEELFAQTFALGRGRGWRFNHSSLYLDFLAGRRALPCSPWGNPTRNIFGWQKPCYLLEDGYVPTYRQLLESAAWDRCGPGRDPRCTDCMVHAGFEPTAVVETLYHPVQAFRSGAAYKRLFHPAGGTRSSGQKWSPSPLKK